jgi:GWxTD domain-containing protein
MRGAMIWVVALGLVTGPASAVAGQNSGALTVRMVRFYRPDSRQTAVKGFIQIPYTLMEPTGSGTGGALSYQVSVRVSDSTGLQLLENQWRGHARAETRQPGAYALEMVDFVVSPGRYRFEVEVLDSVSGHETSATADLQGFGELPVLSDLLISPQMRVAVDADSAPGPGELKRGNTFITGAAEVLLTPLRSRLYYMVEAYAARETSGTLTVAVVDSGGKTVTQTRPTLVKIAEGGGMLRGQLDLAGLPGGRYRLNVSLSAEGQTSERAASFQMADLAQTMAKDSARRAFERTTDDGYFAEMIEAQLDEAEAPLIYIAEQGELSVYKEGLSLGAKRQFLAQFWKKRNRTPGGVRNEERERFYDAIAFVNAKYSESGRAGLPGWKTDRGRIHIKNGAPDDLLTRPRVEQTLPYIVWRFTRGKARYYVFSDRTGLGNYQLILSNDLKEPGLANWADILGRDAVLDVSRFIGMDLTQH